MAIPRFSFYDYVDQIKELISDGFPILNTVTFQPSDEGEDVKYSDFGVPAFLMSFGDPEFISSVPMREVDVADASIESGGALSSRTGYYAKIRANVSGTLVLPRFKTDGQNTDNLNMSIAVFQAATNIAALIFAKARGWNCDPAVIGNISYEADSDYHTAIIEWSHEALVGREEGDSSALGQGLGRFLEDIDVSRDLRFVVPSLAIEDVGDIPVGGIHAVLFTWYVFNIETVSELPTFDDAESDVIYVLDGESWVKKTTMFEMLMSDDYDSTYHRVVDVDLSNLTENDITILHYDSDEDDAPDTIPINTNGEGVGTFLMPAPTASGEKVEITVKANAIAEGNVETKKTYQSTSTLTWEVA